MLFIQTLLAGHPPHRLIFQDPDKPDHIYTATTKAQLVADIITYRSQNRLAPILNINEVLEDYWCSLPENAGKCRPIKLKRGWIAYKEGGINLLKNIFFGDENMVAPGEAERRAQICVQCPKNIFPDRGPFIAWADRIAQASTDGRTVPSQDQLGNCEVCTCNLRAKVWSKDAKVAKELNSLLPDFCWAKTK